MKLKVCGMREPDNLKDLFGLSPDFVGMIFYPGSPRYVAQEVSVDWPDSIHKVGVFVNPTVDEVTHKVQAWALDYVQLHGGESVDFVRSLYESGIKVIKVFSVMDELPTEKMKPYEPFISYFLFDTKTPKFGGSGTKFNWGILSAYDLKTPFILSGGIDMDDLDNIKSLKLEKLEVIDINSRFETAPALKDIEKISAFKKAL